MKTQIVNIEKPVPNVSGLLLFPDGEYFETSEYIPPDGNRTKRTKKVLVHSDKTLPTGAASWQSRPIIIGVKIV